MSVHAWLVTGLCFQAVALIILFVRLARVETLLRGMFTRFGGRKGG